ncbi:zinc finger protein 2-like [Maniola jurtina]|uniref:zinc finger protein 2-like n=1 Tax=Maniola jurtina TaxID=191418 RepID=UPI001E686B58|nr:zinc finger protein 2-like [Maniola jurtina]
MRCCVHFCKNTSDNIFRTIPSSDGELKEISFHGFPSEVHLRAAWLRALGKPDNLPDSAVICSQHFLNDDIYETESGLRQIHTGAIPSTVQVCLICLDTDSKMLLMSKHNLQEAYEKLTGQPLCDQGNLKQTLCVQCAQRLINSIRFRDKSLRARELMMSLVEKHELITRRHIKIINRTKHQLKSNMELIMLGPDHCNLHIVEHPSEDKHTEIEETGHQVLVKTEGSDDSMSVVEEFITSNGEDISDYSIMMESRALDEALSKALERKHVYMRHMSANLQKGDSDGECETSQVCRPHTAVSSSSAHSSLITENKQADPSPSTHSAQTLGAPLPASLATNNETKVRSTEQADTDASCQNKRLTDCVVKLYNVFSKKVMPRLDETLKKTRKTCCLQSKTDFLKNDINIKSNNLSQNSSHTEESWFICDICRKMYKRKRLLVKHIKTHAEVRQFTCKVCQYKCKYQCQLRTHMRTHTGERPLLCKLCNYKFTTNSSLATHLRTHTDIKPFSCKLCDYKTALSGSLVRHMRTHTGEKPFACKLCAYKCTVNGSLVMHMRTHSGEKPFLCNLCNYKCTTNSGLVAHMRTHTGERPFLCNLCNYKCTASGSLVRHMRTHTGERPFLCKLCNYKCTRNTTLARHMRTHTGERPFLCKLCNYKYTTNWSLVMHMRTHTGEKPYSCTTCEYKCADRSNLMKHIMRTHTATGEKPSPCS